MRLMDIGQLTLDTSLIDKNFEEEMRACWIQWREKKCNVQNKQRKNVYRMRNGKSVERARICRVHASTEPCRRVRSVCVQSLPNKC